MTTVSDNEDNINNLQFSILNRRTNALRCDGDPHGAKIKDTTDVPGNCKADAAVAFPGVAAANKAVSSYKNLFRQFSVSIHLIS